MPRLRLQHLFVAVALCLSPPVGAVADDARPSVDALVRAMTDALAAAGAFTVHVEKSFDDVLVTGEKLRYAGALDIAVRRPDRFHVSYGDDLSAKEVWYDGARLTLIDLRAGVFGELPAEATIDATLDAVAQAHGLEMPLAALLAADAHDAFAENVTRSRYVGLHDVGGAPAHHLFFTDGAVEWQLWIDAGDTPLPLRLVVTHADQPREPQTTFEFETWTLSADLPDEVFAAAIPPGAARAAFLPAGGD